MNISGKNWENKSAKADLQSSSESRKGTEKGSEVGLLATGSIRARWETAQRWYEAELVLDPFNKLPSLGLSPYQMGQFSVSPGDLATPPAHKDPIT